MDFGQLFYKNILEPDKIVRIITWEFVEDLSDSMREREESLADFISVMTSIDESDFTHVKDHK